MDGVKNGTETDTDCGGSCGPCGDTKGCGAGKDCTSGVCTAGKCAAATCTDVVKNGKETDVDCGGGTCAKCSTGKACVLASDCTSVVCKNAVCQAPLCTDGAKNGTETDIDCGGGACATCTAGQTCAAGSDCQSGVCTGGKCQAPSCTDGVKNGTETDTDCGGATCDAAGKTCANGAACLAAADCQSNLCTSMICKAGGLSLVVEGHANVSVQCKAGDYSCEAQQLCNLITGEVCVWQQYDCCTGSSGSWYPPSSGGGSSFNFAYTYDFGCGGDYGNICDCARVGAHYGLAENHVYCGSGHWQRQ
jgi:hypothetical protein